MVSHIVKRVWVVLIAVVFTLLGFTSPTLALNGHPVEGEHYRIVRGPNSGSTYIKVTPGVNINTPLLAEALHTTPHDIRADNPTKTLALCHVQGDGYRMGSGIDSPDKRASNAVWQSCPDQKEQYVYIVPGETVEITGVKRLSFNEEQKVLTGLKACTDQACVMDKARVLGANVSGQPTVTPSVTPFVASPAPPVAPSPDTAMAQRVAALEAENAKLRADALLWTDTKPPIFFDAADMVKSLSVQNDALRAEAAVGKRNMRILLGLFIAAILGLALSLQRTRTLSRVNRFYLQDKQALFREVENLRADPVRLRQEIDRQRVELEGKVVAKAKELKAQEAKHALTLAAKDEAVLRSVQSTDTVRRLLNEKEGDFRRLRVQFVHFLTDLHMKLRGGTLLAISDSSDLKEEVREALGLVDAKNADLSEAIARIGLVVEGSGEKASSRPFSFERLHEITELLILASNEMEVFCDGDVTSITGRVKQCCSDSALSRMRTALEQKALQIAKLQTSPPPPPTVDAEEYGTLLGENAKLAMRVVELEGQVKELEECLEPSPRTLAFPDMQRPSSRTLIMGGIDDAPEVTVSESSEDDDEVTASNPPVTKDTLAPPDPHTSHLDLRSEKLISAYSGLEEWTNHLEGHVVRAIEHDSELAALHKLALRVTRVQFRCFDDRGGNVLFRVTDLINGKFAQTLRASAPSVG